MVTTITANRRNTDREISRDFFIPCCSLNNYLYNYRLNYTFQLGSGVMLYPIHVSPVPVHFSWQEQVNKRRWKWFHKKKTKEKHTNVRNKRWGGIKQGEKKCAPVLAAVKNPFVRGGKSSKNREENYCYAPFFVTFWSYVGSGKLFFAREGEAATRGGKWTVHTIRAPVVDQSL